MAFKRKSWAKKVLDGGQIPASFVFECLGVIAAVFIPITILLLVNGVETRIDRPVINELLNLDWFFGLLFGMVLIAIKEADGKC